MRTQKTDFHFFSSSSLVKKREICMFPPFFVVGAFNNMEQRHEKSVFVILPLLLPFSLRASSNGSFHEFNSTFELFLQTAAEKLSLVALTCKWSTRNGNLI